MRYTSTLIISTFFLPALALGAGMPERANTIDEPLIQSGTHMQLAAEQGTPEDPDRQSNAPDDLAPGGDTTPSGVDTEPSAPIDPDRVDTGPDKQAPGGDNAPDADEDTPQEESIDPDRAEPGPEDLAPGGSVTPDTQ